MRTLPLRNPVTECACPECGTLVTVGDCEEYVTCPNTTCWHILAVERDGNQEPGGNAQGTTTLRVWL